MIRLGGKLREWLLGDLSRWLVSIGILCARLLFVYR